MKSKIITVFAVLFGVFLLNAGLNKFFEYMPMPKPEEMPAKMLEAMGAFKTLTWLMPLVGVAEIIGGLFCIWPRTRALGAIILLPVMVGIVLTNATTDPKGLAISLPLLLINVLIIIVDYKKFLPLVNRDK
jgi:uncharacterized membrane protein YphA (DoxX/SURF4 family)